MRYFLHSLLPKKHLSALMYRLSRIENTVVKNMFIRLFMAITGASLSDARRKQISEYCSLLDFFTRELDANARPIKGNENSIVCPVDGRVAHVGDIQAGKIFQIKGHDYSLSQLVSSDYAEKYHNGLATTIYLAPFDYHRIHMPLDGTLQRACYIPGELNSVSIALLDKIPGLFARNERVVLEFTTEQENNFIMVLVGAVNVGSIETVMHGEICPNRDDATYQLDCKQEKLKKGEELGRFNLGSTIIFISQANHHQWENLAAGQKTKLGEVMATLNQRLSDL